MAKTEEAIDVEKLLEQATLRAIAFEEAIQTGEADVTDEEKRALKIARERAKKLVKYRSDVQQTIARAEGRRVLWRVLEIAGPNRISHTPGDPYHTAFNEGKRAVANEVLMMLLDADPDVYARMQREFISDQKSEAARLKRELEETNG